MELPSALASLQLQDSNVTSSAAKNDAWEDVMKLKEAHCEPEGNEVRRSLRKRIGVPLGQSIKKQKLNPNLTTHEEMMKHYLNVNKSSRVKSTNLETIFEEPKEKEDGGVVTMSNSKFRRSILFNSRHSKTKKLKRSAKAKKNQTLNGLKKEKKKRLSVEEVKKRLSEMLCE